MNFRDGMAQIQRNMIIVQALLQIAPQAAGNRLYFKYGLHMRALQCQPSGHNHANIPGAQYDDFMSHHTIVQIDVRLRRTGGKHTGWALARNGQRAARPFPAAHRQHNRLGLHLPEAKRAGDGN